MLARLLTRSRPLAAALCCVVVVASIAGSAAAAMPSAMHVQSAQGEVDAPCPHHGVGGPAAAHDLVSTAAADGPGDRPMADTCVSMCCAICFAAVAAAGSGEAGPTVRPIGHGPLAGGRAHDGELHDPPPRAAA